MCGSAAIAMGNAVIKLQFISLALPLTLTLITIFDHVKFHHSQLATVILSQSLQMIT